MRKVHIGSVQPGARTARPILTETGSVLLGAGVELSARYLDRLKSLGIDSIYIEDARTDGIEPVEPISDKTRRDAVQLVHANIQQAINSQDLRARTTVPMLGDAFRQVFTRILDDLKSMPNVLVNLTNIQVMEGYLFHHSVNVAVLAGIIGMAKGYNKQQLTDLGVGALLFDVGMTMLPKELYSFSGSLNEADWKRVNKHAEDGFNLLRSQHDISLLSAHCALQHHERYDGSGYPRGLKGSEIHEYAQIVGIADVFDAMISPRPFRPRYTPSEAVEYLFASGNSKFDITLIRQFLGHVAIYPVASTVKLSTGQTGVVVRNDPRAPHRPVVRILEEKPGVPSAAPYEMDLQKEMTIVILSSD